MQPKNTKGELPTKLALVVSALNNQRARRLPQSSALAGLETGVLLVDDIHTTFATDHTAILVTGLKGLQ
jgi:hypothetical protein